MRFSPPARGNFAAKPRNSRFNSRWRRAITARFVGDPAQTAFTVNGAAYEAEFRANSRNHTLQAQIKLRW